MQDFVHQTHLKLVEHKQLLLRAGSKSLTSVLSDADCNLTSLRFPKAKLEFLCVCICIYKICICVYYVCAEHVLLYIEIQ